MQSLSYSPHESNDSDAQSDHADCDPRPSMPSASSIQPRPRLYKTKPTSNESHSSLTLQTTHKAKDTSSNPHTPGHVIPALDSTMSPVIRRQFLASVIAACTREELSFVSKTVAPLLKVDFLYQLPVELAFHILTFIDDVQTLSRAAQVCKYWFRVVRDDGVWRRMCAIYGFGDCKWAEREFQRTQKRRMEERAKRKEVARKLHSDEDHEKDERRRTRSVDRSMEYSYRRHFKNSYIIRTNWQKGGKLLKAHELPIVSPDAGTVTSLALDSDWVVVGFSNSMIKIFSASKGVLCRTLVGHKSGVWSVCLVSEGGYRLSDSNSAPTPQTAESSSMAVAAGRVSASAVTREFVQVALPSPARRSETSRRRPSVSLGNPSSTTERPKFKVEKETKGKEHAKSSSSTAVTEELSTLTLEDEKDPPRKKKKKPKPLSRTSYGIPPPMAKALGISPHYNEDPDDSGGPSSSNSATEDLLSPPASNTRDKRRRPKQRPNRPYSEVADDMEHAEDREEFRDLEASGAITRSCSSRGWGQPNAIIVSGGCDKSVRIWDVVSGQCIYTLDGHRSTIRTMRVLHNRPIAVTGSRDATLRVWDIQLGRCLRVLEGHDHSVRCLEVHENRVVSGSYDNTCRVWNVDTGQCIHVLQGHLHQVYSVAYDGVRIASGGLDTTIRIWDAETGQCVALLQGHASLVCEIQLTSTILATGGSDGGVIAFSLATYQVLYRVKSHESSITSLQLDDQYLVTGGSDGHVKLYEAPTGKFVREMNEASDNVWKVAFGRETCAVMCRRGNRTVVEIWTLGPNAHRVPKNKDRLMEWHRKKKERQRGDGAEPNVERPVDAIDEPGSA